MRTLKKGGMPMDIFQFMQAAAFALAFFMAGYTIGQKKK
jgi:hypothetical protein